MRHLLPLLLALGCVESPADTTPAPLPILEIPIDAARWADWQAQTRAEHVVEDLALQATLHATALAELHAALTETPLAPAFIKAVKVREDAAWAYTQIYGVPAYLATGRRRALTLLDAFDGLLAVSRETKRSLRDLLADPSADPRVAAYRGVGGAFALFAESLVVDGHLPQTQRGFVVGLFMDNWSAILRHRLPVEGSLRAIERVWLLRWRLERQPNLPLARRLALADELSRVPTYPGAHYNAAVYLYNAGHTHAAAARFALAPQALAPLLRLLSQTTSP